MDAKKFQKLTSGTKVQMDMNGDTAIGTIVTKMERTGRGRIFACNFVQVIEAEPASRWAQYLGRQAQEFHFAFVAGTI